MKQGEPETCRSNKKNQKSVGLDKENLKPVGEKRRTRNQGEPGIQRESRRTRNPERNKENQELRRSRNPERIKETQEP